MLVYAYAPYGGVQLVVCAFHNIARHAACAVARAVLVLPSLDFSSAPFLTLTSRFLAKLILKIFPALDDQSRQRTLRR